MSSRWLSVLWLLEENCLRVICDCINSPDLKLMSLLDTRISLSLSLSLSLSPSLPLSLSPSPPLSRPPSITPFDHHVMKTEDQMLASQGRPHQEACPGMVLLHGICKGPCLPVFSFVFSFSVDLFGLRPSMMGRLFDFFFLYLEGGPWRVWSEGGLNQTLLQSKVPIV